jgi:hypothetical protein
MAQLLFQSSKDLVSKLAVSLNYVKYETKTLLLAELVTKKFRQYKLRLT